MVASCSFDGSSVVERCPGSQGGYSSCTQYGGGDTDGLGLS